MHFNFLSWHFQQNLFILYHSLFTRFVKITHKIKSTLLSASEAAAGVVLLKNSVPKNLANFTGKHLRWSIVSIKLQEACNFIGKILQHKYFPVKSAKFLRTAILQNICERLVFKFIQIKKWMIRGRLG